ncbi:MAG: aspartate/glutamate racemase family protein [Anaerolineae bacterium]
MKKLALLHTVVWLLQVFQDLCSELMPGVETYHVVDESLLREAIRVGNLTPRAYRAVARYAVSAQEGGADAVLVTCSSISPCVDVAQRLVSIPVLKIDEAMVDKAVRIGRKIGVVATLSSTLNPTSALVRERARLLGKEVEVRPALCEGAFEAASAGNMATHDTLVREALRHLAEQVDVIVLAQASMARVADQLDEKEKTVPILSSPRLGVMRAREVLEGRQ